MPLINTASIAIGSQFSSYRINYPSITSGTASFIEELNSESLSEGREGEIEREDLFLFPYFPSSHFFSYITCCDYNVTEKPAVVVFRLIVGAMAEAISWFSHASIMLVSGNCVARL